MVEYKLTSSIAGSHHMGNLGKGPGALGQKGALNVCNFFGHLFIYYGHCQEASMSKTNFKTVLFNGHNHAISVFLVHYYCAISNSKPIFILYIMLLFFKIHFLLLLSLCYYLYFIVLYSFYWCYFYFSLSTFCCNNGTNKGISYLKLWSYPNGYLGDMSFSAQAPLGVLMQP